MLREEQHGKVVENLVKEVKLDQKILNQEESQIPSIKMGNLQSNKTVGAHDKDAPGTKIYSMEEVKQLVQQICQNTNPLGKLVEYIDDDLQSMHQENLKWNQQFLETKGKLEKVEGEQDEEFKGYNEKVQELKEQIFDWKGKINVVK